MTDPIYGDISLYQDIHGIEQIKSGSDQQVALGKAADQFEVQFLQMVLKNMREASNSLSEGDTLLNSDQQQFYQEMYDDQLAATLVKNGSVGLSDSIVSQLGNQLKSQS
nr:rod-binding protein [uncultured Tolumonas sp.]